MAQPVFATAYQYVNGELNVFLGQKLSSVQSAVAGPLRLAITLYVILYGIAVIRGAIKEPILDGVNRLIKILFIYLIAVTPAFNTYVTTPLFTTLPNFLTSAISGSQASTLGAGFDDFMYRGLSLAHKTAQAGSIGNFFPYLAAALICVCAVVVAGFGFAIMLVSLVTLAILVALGPIFIALLVFEPTRRYFFSWLNQGITALATFALIITVFQLIDSLIIQQWESISAIAEPDTAGLVYCAYAVLGGLFFLHIPTLAAGLAGGVGSAARDFVNAGAQVASAVATSGASAPASAAGAAGRAGRTGGSIGAGGSGGASRASGGRLALPTTSTGARIR